MKKLGLTDEEWSKLVDAFPKVAVLIGSADGEMDDEEKAWSKKVAHIRTFSGRAELFDLYEDVKAVMESRISQLQEAYTNDAQAAEIAIIDDLTEVNSILQKIDPVLGNRLSRDLKSFAVHVGKASGGFLRFFSVSKSERNLAQLPMLEDIEIDEEE